MSMMMENRHYFDAEHPLRPYIGSRKAYAESVLPGNALRGDAPSITAGFWPCESGGVFVRVEDHRERREGDVFGPEAAQPATPYWLPGDTWKENPRTMTEIGPLPEGALLERPAKSAEEQTEALRREFVNALQEYLDAFARTRNYDGILSAASYATSTDPRFAAEGQYAVELRDAVWAKGYAVLDEVLAGARPLPSMDEVLAELPRPVWPERTATGGAA